MAKIDLDKIEKFIRRESVFGLVDLKMALVLDLIEHLREAKEVLEFYGDPMTYFAIGIFPDPPCGEFINDYSEAVREADGVIGHFPGAKARAMLEKLEK